MPRYQVCWCDYARIVSIQHLSYQMQMVCLVAGAIAPPPPQDIQLLLSQTRTSLWAFCFRHINVITQQCYGLQGAPEIAIFRQNIHKISVLGTQPPHPTCTNRCINCITDLNSELSNDFWVTTVLWNSCQHRPRPSPHYWHSSERQAFLSPPYFTHGASCAMLDIDWTSLQVNVHVSCTLSFDRNTPFLLGYRSMLEL